MPIARQRQWRIQNQYTSLNEYNSLKTSLPPGIYISLTPSNFSLWSGVLFIRTGPYAPAILRFQIAFPAQYPSIPPLILFTSDIFHPLITPLTTYTYSTSTPASGGGTISAGDEERLLPGGLSLRHGFPGWFDRDRANSRAGLGMVFKDIDLSSAHPSSKSASGTTDGGIARPAYQQHRRPLSFHIPPPKEDAVDLDDIAPSIAQVLEYMKRVFEDESLLDDLPLEAAANTGAWYAWQAHRRKTSKPLPKVPGGADGSGSAKDTSPRSPRQQMQGHGRSYSLNTPMSAAKQGTIQSTTPQTQMAGQQKKTMADWNWDGVWVDRVKKGINMSLSDAVLYGNGEGDDLIHFLDADDEGYSNFRESISGHVSSNV